MMVLMSHGYTNSVPAVKMIVLEVLLDLSSSFQLWYYGTEDESQIVPSPHTHTHIHEHTLLPMKCLVESCTGDQVFNLN